MARMIKEKLTDAEVEYIAGLEKEYHAKLHSQGLCRCPSLTGVGLSKAAAEPHEEAVMWNQILQKLDLLADKLQQLVKDAPNWLPLLQVPGRATKASNANMRDRIAAEVKKTLDKMILGGSASTLEVVSKAQEEKGWAGVEELAATVAKAHRYIG